MSRRAVEWCKQQVHIRGAARGVLWVLCDHANDHDRVWVSELTIAAESGYSDRTVRTVLAEFTSGDWPVLRFIRKRPKNVSEWQILLPVSSEVASDLESGSAEVGSELDGSDEGASSEVASRSVRKLLPSSSEVASDKPQEPQEEPQDDDARDDAPPSPTSTSEHSNGHPRRNPADPLTPLPPSDNPLWRTMLPAVELNMQPHRSEYRLICESLRHRGALQEFRAARKELLRATPRGQRLHWSTVVELAQRIGAEWEDRARPDPNAQQQRERAELHRRLGIGQGGTG